MFLTLKDSYLVYVYLKHSNYFLKTFYNILNIHKKLIQKYEG